MTDLICRHCKGKDFSIDEISASGALYEIWITCKKCDVCKVGFEINE
jgi:hypothetical protein